MTMTRYEAMTRFPELFEGNGNHYTEKGLTDDAKVWYRFADNMRASRDKMTLEEAEMEA
jgi:hypothetical protein